RVQRPPRRDGVAEFSRRGQPKASSICSIEDTGAASHQSCMQASTAAVATMDRRNYFRRNGGNPLLVKGQATTTLANVSLDTRVVARDIRRSTGMSQARASPSRLA